MAKHYDLVVIGAGTAAMTGAMRVRAAGKQVAVIDYRPFGGTCALRGCDPKKMLIGQNERNAHPDTHKRTKLEQGGVTRRRGCCRVVSSSRRGDFASVGKQVISVTGRALPRTG